MQREHTPGPWRVDLREMRDGWVIVVDDNEGIVANVNTESGPDIPPLVSREMPAGAADIERTAGGELC